jgi:hypothetical protein
VKIGANLEPERLHALDEDARALDRAARTIESGEEAVSSSVDLLAVELIKPSADEGVPSPTT